MSRIKTLALLFGLLFAATNANAYTCARGTVIGSGLCQFGITTTSASNQTTAIPSDWTNTNEIDVISGGSTGSGAGGSTQIAAGCGGTSTKLVNTTAIAASSTATFFLGIQATTASAGVGTAGSNIWLCPSSTNCASLAGTNVIVGAPGAGAVNGNGSTACTPGATASAIPSANAKLGGVGGHSSSSPGGHAGGGAASPFGAGCAGGTVSGANLGGAGGGGEGGVSCTAGVGPTTANGGAGGANAAGTAGPAGGTSGNPGTAGTAGTNGTGGSGSGGNTGATAGNAGGNGSMGLEWSNISLGAGSGGAGSGGNSSTGVPGAPGDGGQCGGGGGVSGDNNAFAGNAHIGAGGIACMIVTYQSSTFTPPTPTGGLFFPGAF